MLLKRSSISVSSTKPPPQLLSGAVMHVYMYIHLCVHCLPHPSLLRRTRPVPTWSLTLA
jgi:hypothetical protein